MYETLALLAGFALVYSAVAGGVERSRLSGPIVFTLFGLAVGPARLGPLDLDVSNVCLAGTGERTESRLFMGWFGPCGLASIVFVLIVIDADLPHARMLAQGVAWTVMLSVLAHGLNANSWARGFGARAGVGAERMRQPENS